MHAGPRVVTEPPPEQGGSPSLTCAGLSLGLGSAMLVHSLMGRHQLHLLRVYSCRNENRLPAFCCSVSMSCSSSESSPQHCHCIFTSPLNGDVPSVWWVFHSPALNSRWPVQLRSTRLQLEASLRNYLTHLGQIIVSKET